MAVIEPVRANSVASSAHQNGLIDQVNANTGEINSLGSRTTALETDSQTYAMRTSAVLMHRYAAATQTIQNTTWTKMVVNQGVTSTGKVTVSNNNTFTVNEIGRAHV